MISTQTTSSLRGVSTTIKDFRKGDHHQQDTTTNMMDMTVMTAMMATIRDRAVDGITGINKAMQIQGKAAVGGMRT